MHVTELTRQVSNLFQDLRFRGKTAVWLNDCFLGKASLAKNHKMHLGWGGGMPQNLITVF